MALPIRDRTETTLSEINVTPLVDVMLVLLIIFMITAPMLASSVEVDLQQATMAPPTDADEQLVISITAQRKIFVAEVPTDLAILPDRVREAIRATGVDDIAVRGDKSVPYGVVLEVIDALKAADITSVGLVMDPPDQPLARRP